MYESDAQDRVQGGDENLGAISTQMQCNKQAILRNVLPEQTGGLKKLTLGHSNIQRCAKEMEMTNLRTI